MDEANASDRDLPVTELASSETGDFCAPVHDCWNRIGVEGNATCRELVKYIHCRNCPVYSAAGLQLLDRPLPPEYRRERAEHYAQRKTISRPARLSVIIFRIANEWFALPTTAFQEVAEYRVMHSLPRRRRGLALGLVNVRGELLVCAAAAQLLGVNRSEPEAQSSPSEHGTVYDRLLVAVWDGQRVVFPVNEVQGIQRIQQDELKETPATLSKSSLTYTEGVFAWGGRTVGLLNAEAFFTTLNRSLA